MRSIKAKFYYVDVSNGSSENFMDTGQELARALRAAYWAMHRRTNAILAKHGVTADQFVLLSRLADEDAITQQELARRASSDANTIRPMLLLLQRRGLVVRNPHASDGRAHCVVLTEKGRRSFRAMMVDTEACRRQILSSVKHGSAKGMSKNLAHIADTLDSSSQRDLQSTADRAAGKRIPIARQRSQ